MAQKHAPDCAGAGGFEFTIALAACFAGGRLDGSIGGAGFYRDNGVVARSVVSELLPFLDLGRVLVKPMRGARGSGADICHFNNAGGTDYACDGQRPFAPQALANRPELLEAGEGRRFARPIILVPSRGRPFSHGASQKNSFEAAPGRKHARNRLIALRPDKSARVRLERL